MNAQPPIILEAIAPGDTLFAGSGLEGVVEGPKRVRDDTDGRLWVDAGGGKAYLDELVNEDGLLQGFTAHWPAGARTSKAASSNVPGTGPGTGLGWPRLF
jgi:hypothetical protein